MAISRRALTLSLAVGATGLALAGMGALAPAIASAQTTGPTSYSATLTPVPLNGAKAASGTVTLTLTGDTAAIHEQVSGLASTFKGKPFPHVQHIHGGGQGVCPTAAADANHDGVISTPEGQPSYGSVLTTLSTSGDTSPSAATDTGTAPSGSSFIYDRTITLDPATVQSLEAGKAVVVVHGIDPSTAAPAAASSPSPLVPSLPLAATAPALCGTLTAAQVSAVPSGAPQTGGGSTAGLLHGDLLAAGGGMVVLGTGMALARRRRSA